MGLNVIQLLRVCELDQKGWRVGIHPKKYGVGSLFVRGDGMYE